MEPIVQALLNRFVLIARGCVGDSQTDDLFGHLSDILVEVRHLGVTAPFEDILSEAQALYDLHGFEGPADRFAACVRLIGACDQVLVQFWHRLRRDLDELRTKAFNFGVCVEQGRYREDVFVFMDRATPGILPPESNQPVSMAQILSTSYPGPLHPELDSLRSTSIGAGQLEPPPGWLAEVRTRWAEMRLPVTLLPRFVQDFEVIDAPIAGARVLELEQAFFGAIARSEGTPARPPSPEPGYFGLLLNENALTVGRIGFQEAVELSPLKFEIVRLLIGSRAEYQPVSRFAFAWERAELASPSNGVITNEICELRPLVAPPAHHNPKQEPLRLSSRRSGARAQAYPTSKRPAAHAPSLNRAAALQENHPINFLS